MLAPGLTPRLAPRLTPCLTPRLAPGLAPRLASGLGNGRGGRAGFSWRWNLSKAETERSGKSVFASRSPQLLGHVRKPLAPGHAHCRFVTRLNPLLLFPVTPNITTFVSLLSAITAIVKTCGCVCVFRSKQTIVMFFSRFVLSASTCATC